MELGSAARAAAVLFTTYSAWLTLFCSQRSKKAWGGKYIPRSLIQFSADTDKWRYSLCLLTNDGYDPVSSAVI